MIIQELKPVLDTLSITQNDTLLLKSYIQNQIIQLSESKNLIDYLNDWVPIGIAFIALVLTIGESIRRRKDKKIQRIEEKLKRKEELELLKLQNKPVLSYNNLYTNNKVATDIVNSGLGVAFITEYYFELNGEKFDKLYDILGHIIKGQGINIDNIEYSDMIDNHCIGPNTEENFFSFYINDELQFEKFFQKFEDVNIIMHYKNLFDDHLPPIEITYKNIRDNINKVRETGVRFELTKED